MAILRAADVRAMSREDRTARLKQLREELFNERGVAAMGGSPPSPGKIRQLRTAIARIHTINRLEETGKIKFSQKEEATGAAQQARRTLAATTGSSTAKKTAPKKKAASKPTGSAGSATKQTSAKTSATKAKSGG